MAKATRAQEVSTGTSDSFTEHELSDPSPPIRIRRAMLGEVDRPLAVGGDSTQSSESEPTSSGSQNRDHQQPAQTTENPSNKSHQADSDADLMDGNTPETVEESAEVTRPAARKTAAKKHNPPPAKRARARTTDDYDFD